MIIKLLFLLITAGLSIYAYRLYGAPKAYNQFLLPVLLLFPVVFFLEVTPGIPPFTFFIVAMLPQVVLVLHDHRLAFRWNLVDVLVLLFPLVCGAAASVATSPKYGLWVFLDKTLSAMLPYFLTRIVVKRENALRTLYWLAVFLTFIALFSPLEYLFNVTPVQVLQKIWPDWVMWSAFIRGGFHRVYSTFGHPIHAGMMFSLGVLVGFLLWRLRVFSSNTIPFAMMAINAMAVFSTVSRSSTILMAPLLLMINFPFVKKKVLYASVLLGILFTVLVVALPIYQNYIETAYTRAGSEEATSAAYRAELFDNYINKVMESPLVGYGFHVPVVNKQFSIDNYYLYLGLYYGLPAVIVLILTFTVVLGWGLIGFFQSQHSKDKILLWTALTMVAFYAFMCSAVWMTGQARDILYILFALAVNFLVPSKDAEPLWSRKLKWI